MKNKLAKFFAIILVFTLVFSFAACSGGNDDETTAATTLEDATEAGATTAPDTTVTGDVTDTTATTVPDNGTTGTTKPGETTTKAPVTNPVTIKAPVGGSIAEIVAFYNQYANATKAYKGKITVSGKQGTSTKINSLTAFFGSVPSGVTNKANEMVPNNFKAITTKTFKNGTEVGGTSTLKRTLPCDDSDKMSTLQASGVKSATCVKNSSGGWKIFINLKEETCNNLNDVPKYHGSCMDTVSLTAKDLDPFTLVSAKVVYTDKSTITAVVNSNGLLDSVSIYEPDHLTGVLKYIISVNADVTGTWEQYLNFKY